jgi:hypothetical protein
MRPRFLSEVLRPALADRRGRLTLIGTPKGHNEFWERYEAAADDPEWFRMMLRASETGLISEEELTSAKRMMSENQYAQEFECSFEAAIEGAYYGALLEAAGREGRICELPVRQDLPVYTAWDLGVGDDTSIWFAQRNGGWLHIIDHYATNGQPASHYVAVINQRGYNYAEHFLPHDVDSREWGNGLRRIDTLRNLGLKNLRILDRTPVDDGINAVRIVLPTCRFDAVKCGAGLESLKQYRREYDENKRTFKPTPLHDWTSHDADAFRYLAQGMKPEAAIPLDIPRYTPNRRKWRNGGSSTSWLTA